MPSHVDPKQHLTKLQWEVLTRFFSTPISAPFFLTGGTGLAGFYFGHRKSVDLDLFTLNPLDRDSIKALLNRIAKELGGIYAIRTDQPTILTGFVTIGAETLKVDVVHDIPVHTGEFLVHNEIRVDSVENIGSNKITAIYGRSEAKDYLDLFWILKKDQVFSFETLLEAAKKKDIGISGFHLGHQFLTMPSDQLFPTTAPAVSIPAIRIFFQKLGEDLIAHSEKPQYG